MTDNTSFARSEANDDVEDIGHGNIHALQLKTKELAGSRFTSVLSLHQLGSTHDPFSQFPVRWEESFGPLIHFCKYFSLDGLVGGSKRTRCQLKLCSVIKSSLVAYD